MYPQDRRQAANEALRSRPVLNRLPCSRCRAGERTLVVSTFHAGEADVFAGIWRWLGVQSAKSVDSDQLEFTLPYARYSRYGAISLARSVVSCVYQQASQILKFRSPLFSHS